MMMNQLSSTTSDVSSSISSGTSHRQSIPPPDTKDEWFRRESITVWPTPAIENDQMSVEDVTSIMDSVESLEKDLKKHASRGLN